MSFRLSNILFFLLFTTCSYCQTLTEISEKLDSLKKELNGINLTLSNLKTRRDSVTILIENINTVKNRIIIYESREKLIGTVIGINGYLKDEKENQIVPIKEKDSILVFKEFEYPNFKVSYKNKIGFVNYICLILNDEMRFLIKESEIRSAKEKITLEAIKLENEAKKREENNELMHEQRKKRFYFLVKTYGDVNGGRIYYNEYWIGMTSKMAIESLGYPSKINKTTLKGLISEQWIYEKDELNKSILMKTFRNEVYLYFDNNILKAIQD